MKAARIREVSGFVSCSCCSNLAQIWWLKTIEIHSVIVLSIRNQLHEAKIEIYQGCTPSGGYRGEPVLCPFQLLMAAGILWLVATSFQFQPPSLSVHVITFRACLDNPD